MPSPITHITRTDLEQAGNSFLVWMRDTQHWCLQPDNSTNIIGDWTRNMYINGKNPKDCNEIVDYMQEKQISSISAIPNDIIKNIFNHVVMSEFYPQINIELEKSKKQLLSKVSSSMEEALVLQENDIKKESKKAPVSPFEQATANIAKLNTFYVQDLLHFFNYALRAAGINSGWHVMGPTPVCNIQCDENGRIYANVMLSNFKFAHETNLSDQYPFFGNIASRFYLGENGFELAWVNFSNTILATLCTQDEKKTKITTETFVQAYNEEMQALIQLLPTCEDAILRKAIAQVLNTTREIPQQDISRYFGVTSYLKTIVIDPNNKTTLLAIKKSLEKLDTELTKQDDPMRLALQKLYEAYEHHLTVSRPSSASARQNLSLFENKNHSPEIPVTQTKPGRSH